MKPIRILLIMLIICSLVITTAGCKGGEESVVTEEQVIIQTVQRGDLSLDISAVGNLTVSEKETLAFELSGTIDEVLVEEGDYV